MYFEQKWINNILPPTIILHNNQYWSCRGCLRWQLNSDYRVKTRSGMLRCSGIRGISQQNFVNKLFWLFGCFTRETHDEHAEAKRRSTDYWSRWQAVSLTPQAASWFRHMVNSNLLASVYVAPQSTIDVPSTIPNPRTRRGVESGAVPIRCSYSYFCAVTVCLPRIRSRTLRHFTNLQRSSFGELTCAFHWIILRSPHRALTIHARANRRVSLAWLVKSVAAHWPLETARLLCTQSPPLFGVSAGHSVIGLAILATSCQFITKQVTHEKQARTGEDSGPTAGAVKTTCYLAFWVRQRFERTLLVLRTVSNFFPGMLASREKRHPSPHGKRSC